MQGKLGGGKMKRLANIYSQFTHYLEVAVKNFSIVLLVMLICIVFFQVVSRVLTGKSFVQIEELSIVLAAWLGFFALSYTARKRIHVRIDVFVNMLPYRARKIIDVLIDIAVICATAYLVRYGYALAMRKMMVPMMVLPIKAGVQYMAFPAGMACTLFFLIDQLFADIRDSVKGEERLCG